MSKDELEGLVDELFAKIDEIERLAQESKEKVTIIDDTTFLPKEDTDND